MLSRNFPSSQVIAIPNSVDEKLVRDNQLSREQARQDLGIPADAKRVVGTIGRMRPVKGHKYFLEAMRDMEAPPYVAVIGDGELLDEMRAAARESNLSHRLIFAGGRKNAYRYMAAFDAFVMPSLREGLPIAMLEAIASGVPAFGTPVGGIPEILKNRKWVFPKEDPEALRQILIHIANATDEQLEETRQSQQKIFRDNFSIDQYRSRFRSLMEGTVQHSD
ncbi:group 1 glycosyl transferase [Alcanivorax venustensis ISO4]|uniref:Group 1 glycosyl transferase n=2 Tax=Alloalcanivorax venustensis TaxID=172371 RepID=A0ABS0AES9_9GAMM|nr:group 1 glycosyl transferase [Alloalcanivorax venustensis ISO4]